MQLPFEKVRVGELFRPEGATVDQSWVKIVPNHNGQNARAIHSGEFQIFEDNAIVTLVRGPQGKTTPLSTV